VLGLTGSDCILIGRHLSGMMVGSPLPIGDAVSETVGFFVVRKIVDQSEVHRIATAYPEDSRMGERTLSGLLRNIDTETYFVDWEDAK
jgi:hypothetical protein